MTKDEALARFKELGIKPGVTLYTILRHRSSSGMSRRISVIHFHMGEPHQLDYMIEALGVAKHKVVMRYSFSGDTYKDKEEGLVCNGVGMDMGFDLIYRLGRTLYPNGFKVKGTGRNGDKSGHDGGYAFEHRWL